MPPIHDVGISVVMPVWNAEKYLSRAIESMMRQSFNRWELLVADDASVDSSRRLVETFAMRDPRIRMFRRARNSGPAAARNTALREARGQLIAYLDADDEFYPNHLTEAWAIRAEADVLVFGYDLCEERPDHPDFGKTYSYDPRPHRNALIDGHVVVPLGVIHQRELFKRTGLFDEALMRDEDSDLWRRFARIGSSFVFLPLKSGTYHIRSDSLSRSTAAPSHSPIGTLTVPDTPPAEEIRVWAIGKEPNRDVIHIPRSDEGLIREIFHDQIYGHFPLRLIRPQPLVLDMGANVGLFSLYVKRMWSRAATIHCFEPFPASAKQLVQNLVRYSDIYVHRFALSDHYGEGVMHLHPGWSVGHSLIKGLFPEAVSECRVPVRDAATVWDELGLDEVDVMKVDTEGSEVPILTSLGDRLRQVRVVLAEFHSTADRRRIDALLPEHELVGIQFHSVQVGVVRYVRADLLM